MSTVHDSEQPGAGELAVDRSSTALMEHRAPDRSARSLPRRVATSGWLLALAWLFSRAWTFHAWVLHYTYIVGDPRYYNEQLSQPGIDTQLREYPVPVVWVLQFVHWCASGDEHYYIAAFAVLMALLDLGFTLLLWQQAHRRAAWYWTLFTTCMGSLLWFRFDVLPAVIVGTALLLMVRNPRTSGALVGLGTAIKLWPVLVLLPLISRDRDGRRRVLGFAVSGAVLAATSLATAGWTRLISPLTWQSDRGLQIESISGSLLVFLRSRDTQGRWVVQLSQYNAYEIYGPHVATMLQVSSVLTVCAGALALALGVRTLLRGTALDPYLAAMSTVAVIATSIVANKTFSPQYMFWLGAPMAVLLSCASTRGRRIRAILLGVLVLVTCLLTQYIYPGHYGLLLGGGESGRTLADVLLVRNVLCVLVAIGAAVCALLGRTVQRRDADAQVAPEPATVTPAGLTPLHEFPIIMAPSASVPAAASPARREEPVAPAPADD